MLTKNIALAAIASIGLLAASGAYARDNDRWGRGSHPVLTRHSKVSCLSPTHR